MKTIKGPAIFLAQFAGTVPHLQNFSWATGRWISAAGGDNSVALKTVGLAK